jgi:hypothetical protein
MYGSPVIFLVDSRCNSVRWKISFWIVTVLRFAERTLSNDRTVGHRKNRCPEVIATALAPVGVIAESGLWQVEHRASKGEIKVKQCSGKTYPGT